MAFTLKTGLKNSFIILPSDQSQVYLELLLKHEDREQLIQAVEQSFENDYLKSLYSEHPDNIDLSSCKFTILDQFGENHRLTGGNSPKVPLDDESQMGGNPANQFDTLYYAIKLQSSDGKTDQVVGGLEIYGDSECAELGLFIGKKHARKGYGTQAVQLAIKFLTTETGTERIKWECDSNNLASIGVALKCGFKLDEQSFEIYKGRSGSLLYWVMENPPR